MNPATTIQLCNSDVHPLSQDRVLKISKSTPLWPSLCPLYMSLSLDLCFFIVSDCRGLTSNSTSGIYYLKFQITPKVFVCVQGT